jgi:hypothetical protein
MSALKYPIKVTSYNSEQQTVLPKRVLYITQASRVENFDPYINCSIWGYVTAIGVLSNKIAKKQFARICSPVCGLKTSGQVHTQNFSLWRGGGGLTLWLYIIYASFRNYVIKIMFKVHNTVWKCIYIHRHTITCSVTQTHRPTLFFFTLLIYFSKLYCTGHQPTSVADFSPEGTHVKLLIS